METGGNVKEDTTLPHTEKESHPPQSEQTKSEKQQQDPNYLKSSNPGVATFDAANFQVKHPLQNRWTWWYDNPGKKTSQSSWGDHLKKIITIDTVEDFWRLYNNIVKPSNLISGSDYHLFKEHIEPKWEDQHNSKGGKWIVNISNKNGRDNLDRYWLWTILALIGEGFGTDEENEEICGCVVSVRKAQDRIALWTKSATNHNAAVAIGRHLKKVLELSDSITINYQAHSDSQKNNSSYNNKNRYEL
eukprot:TRINITY_DN156_c1_g1_i1.p1 TRINITY_DN156_c1_g1~~TRINITY_DN156_c1_g1_i1.p1  ORF type:complete len:246 (-),score=50.99 TRINITY_DN156_c1_g1_i1:128-865(-)